MNAKTAVRQKYVLIKGYQSLAVPPSSNEGVGYPTFGALGVLLDHFVYLGFESP